MEFSKRLFSVLIEEKISNADLSRKTGISTARISNFCNGKDMPSLNNALILANNFKCSLNYLLGLTDEKHIVLSKREYFVEIFLKRLDFLLKKKMISQKQFCEEIEINKSCISNWRRGQKPKTRNLIKMASMFDCSIDYLLGFE